MGRRLVALAVADPQLAVAAAIEAAGHPLLGHDAGVAAGVGSLGVPISSDLTADVDVIIDFSVPAAAEAIVQTARRLRLPLVVATTGLSPAQIEHLRAAAGEIPLLWSPNMSLAVNLSMKLCEVAAAALADKDADVEIIERHHRFKEDSPSGTALKFGEIIARAMGQTVHRHGRQGRPGKRPHAEIGYHAVRIGDNPGEHTIIFGMLGEMIELRVGATSRDSYAVGGAFRGEVLAGRRPGMYGMNDVLGF